MRALDASAILVVLFACGGLAPLVVVKLTNEQIIRSDCASYADAGPVVPCCQVDAAAPELVDPWVPP